MLMPGRQMNQGVNIPGATVTGNTVVNGYTVPVDLSVNSRTGTLPSEYVASSNVEFSGEFESTVTDEFVAYISDAGYAGTGNLGAGLSGSGGSYRYGFNGKENDNEVKGIGNQQDYGMRIYDPRLGRFLSVDPLTINYPWNSPYSYAEGDPINYEDLDGLERPGTRAQARFRVAEPELSNVRVDRNGRLIAPVGPTSAPIIPPNAGAARVPGGWFVETPNGGYMVSDENPFGPQPTVPKPDMRSQAEKDSDAGHLAFYYFRRELNSEKQLPVTARVEIFTSNPGSLPDWYVQDVKTRLMNGSASANDWKYKEELVRRGVLSSRFGQGQELGRPASGDVLGRNLERAGNVRPHVAHAAHHIIAGGDNRATEARRILASEGIDINEAVNGVFLETGSHRSIHTNDYYRKLTDRLRAAGRGNIRKELNKIGGEIKNGTF